MPSDPLDRPSIKTSRNVPVDTGDSLPTGNRTVLVGWERKRLVPNRFTNPTRSDALGAHSHRLDLAAGQGRLDVLQVGEKPPTGNTGDLRTNTTQVLRLTAGFDHIANLGRLSANFTSS